MNRDYIETWSGRQLWLPDADLDQITIEDIAHALSNICRFAGHIDDFYSVAEHSIHVASLVSDEHKLQALLHDATEAYLCDIPTPFKVMIPQYKELEDNLWYSISEKYNVPFQLDSEVKTADRVMLMTERDFLKSTSKRNWHPKYEDTPRVEKWYPMSLTKNQTKKLFIELFHSYGGKES